MKFTNQINSFSKICLISILAVFIFGCSPKTNSSGGLANQSLKNKYKDQMDEGSTYVYSDYYTMLEKTKNGLFVHKQFFPDTKQITHYYTFDDQKMTKRNGYAKEWWDNGDMRFEGNYKADFPSGEWKKYDKNESSSIVSKGQYVDGEKNGIWVTHNEKNILVAETSYQKGKLHGAYKKFSNEGKLLEKGIYENDQRTHQEVLDSESELAFSDETKMVELMPMFKGCEDISDKEKMKECSDNKMLIFIYSNIKYPGVAREYGVEGRAMANFTVDKNGKIKDLEIKRGICKEIKAEVKRVIDMMPDWHAGVQKGKPVNVRFTLPVSFKLQK